MLSIVSDFDEEVLDTRPYQRQFKLCYRQNLRPLRPTPDSSTLHNETLRRRGVHLLSLLANTVSQHESADANEGAEPLTSANANKNVKRILAEKSDAAEQVLLGILACFDDLKDLLAFAHVNRGLYTTFRRNELGLIKGVLQRQPPTAFGTWKSGRLHSRISELEHYGSPTDPISVPEDRLASNPAQCEEELRFSKKVESAVNTEYDEFADLNDYNLHSLIQTAWSSTISTTG